MVEGATRRRVVITGLGAVSPLGLGVKTYWERLIAGESGIDYISRFNARTFPTRIAGEVRGFDGSDLGCERKLLKYMIRSVQFLALASQMAADDAGIDGRCTDAERVGVSVGCSADFPDLEDIGYHYQFRRNESEMDMAAFAANGNIDPIKGFRQATNTASCVLAIMHGAKGPNTTVHTACASSAHALGTALRMIQHGRAEVMICGGCDSLVTPLGVAAFGLLGALSKRNDPPQKASRPFDRRRDGFVLGEGAGVLILEELSHALGRQAPIHGELVGYGSSSDAYRITDSPPDGRGAVLSMNAAIRDAGLQPSNVQYINAHGTSTPQNDKAETAAIKQVFGEHAYDIPVSAIKSMIGHTISAAAALALISCTLTVAHGVIPPTINYENPDPKCELDYVPNRSRKCDVEVALTNSFGFGGQNASLVVRKFNG